MVMTLPNHQFACALSSLPVPWTYSPQSVLSGPTFQKIELHTHQPVVCLRPVAPLDHCPNLTYYRKVQYHSLAELWFWYLSSIQWRDQKRVDLKYHNIKQTHQLFRKSLTSMIEIVLGQPYPKVAIAWVPLQLSPSCLDSQHQLWWQTLSRIHYRVNKEASVKSSVEVSTFWNIQKTICKTKWHIMSKRYDHLAMDRTFFTSGASVEHGTNNRMLLQVTNYRFSLQSNRNILTRNKHLLLIKSQN